MANETESLGFTVKIDGVDKAISSVKELKLATKQAADEQLKAALKYGEGSQEYIKASKSVSQLRDKMEDLSDSTKSLKGSGIERSTQGFAQLGEGLRNLDFDKVKVGLTAVKSALAATGVMLIVQGVMYLIENFDSLSKGSGLLAKSLRFVGEIISAITDGVNWLTDKLGLTNTAMEKAAEAMIEGFTKSKEALSEQSAEFDRQMKKANAAGQSTVEIEKAKQQAIIDTNKAIMLQIAAHIRAGGEFTDELKKQLTESTALIKNAAADKEAIEIKAEVDSKKKHEEELKRYKEKAEAKKKALEDEFNAAVADQEKQEAERTRLNEIDKKNAAKKLKEEQDAKAIKDKEDEQARNEAVNRLIAESEFKKKLNQEQEDAILDAKQKGVQAAVGLTELAGQLALNASKGNAAKELQVRKAMFAVDKAFNVARTVQDGIRSVQAALTIPPPAGQILAGVNAGLAGINVGKILATNFDGGGSSGSTSIGSTGSISIPSLGSNLNTSVPQLPQTQQQASTSYDAQGRQIPIKAYLVETENRAVTGQVDKYNKQSEY